MQSRPIDRYEPACHGPVGLLQKRQPHDRPPNSQPCRAILTGPRKPSVNQEPSFPFHHARPPLLRPIRMKKAGHRGRPRHPGWRGSHGPRRQSRISAYLGDGDVGCRARGAPTSSRARVEACGSLRRADLGPRHTVDRGASCATPSREVVLCRSAHRPPLDANALASPGPDGPRRARVGGGFAGSAQRFGMGAAKSRGDVSPRAAGGGPIHARLALGNPAVPALRMPPLRREPILCRESPASDAHWSAAGGVPGPDLGGAGSASSRLVAGTPANVG